uniref:T-cell immunomodulatory protein-like n=1 Tax=Sinocyclocheilus rhinocerous TaxID=307959 RepID=A0A673JN34_9TELE
MLLLWAWFLTLLLSFVGQHVTFALQDVTVDLFGPENFGTVAAFGDFNSDKQTDIFIIRKKCTYCSSSSLYFNGDMIPDIFGSVDGSSEVCYLRSRQLKCEKALNLEGKMRVPHSNAFIDLNKDFTADLFLTTKDGFETWINKYIIDLILPPHSLTHSPSFFFSSDGDGSQDHLLPVCMDTECERSAIYLAKPGEKEWVPVLTDFRRKDSVWGFVSSDIPITLHLGDYNMDGFPDALVILRNTSASTQQQAFLLENVACNNASCRQAGRMFRVHWEQSDLSAIPKAVVATFFDIYEDGILDMIVLSKVEGEEELVIHALKNNFEADAYFVKVIVLSGLCSNDCPENVKPFGVNQPGPYVMYTSVDSNGYLKNASAGQLSQSAHLALQLPYTVLGLGRSANFLDHLFVGIPWPPGGKDVRKQEWTAIIPNSQLIVIPYPQNEPRSWSAKLYLTPSNIVLLTAIALIGVCVFILVIIGILHWQEKKADDREKRQEAHRFHFDAM